LKQRLNEQGKKGKAHTAAHTGKRMYGELEIDMEPTLLWVIVRKYVSVCSVGTSSLKDLRVKKTRGDDEPLAGGKKVRLLSQKRPDLKKEADRRSWEC